MAPKTQATAQPVAQQATSSSSLPISQPSLQDVSSPPGGNTINKKKQKRRQKQAARQAQAGETFQSAADYHDVMHRNGLPNPLPPSGYTENHQDHHGDSHSQSGAEEGSYDYDPNYAVPNGAKSRGRNKKKSKPGDTSLHDDHTHPGSSAPPISEGAFRSVSRNIKDGSIWDTNGPEERSRIKAFWLSLSESERKDLVNIEKSHVLQKMKEQQKHSCSCTVCGRKRTAIEEELEVLYEALSEELHHVAAFNRSPFSDDCPFRLKDPRIWADPTTDPSPDRLPSSLTAGPPSRRRVHTISDSQGKDSADDDIEENEYDEEFDDEDYISDEDEIPPNVASDFFQFGNSLTVKDGILTVADDLLKNDGQKFIDMMEQLAERRMQREEDARHHSSSHYHPTMSPRHGEPSHGSQPLEDDEYDDEEDEYDDEEEYEDYEDDDDEDIVDTMSEEQRMEEGRRMFQIFAARMFEQRVVTAYREKVAWERQQALIDEQEQDLAGTSEAKKSKNAEKKKRQRQAAKEAKAQKEAAKEEERLRREAAAREAEEKKREEQRLKQEEQRKKKEAERQAQEEKRKKRETEAMKKLEAERERQQEQEKKQRELKAEEKKKREETERKKREERESKEQEEKERKERDAKAAAIAVEKEVAERKKKEASSSTNSAQAESTSLNRTVPEGHARSGPPPTVVALPPNLKSRNSHDSPSAKIATPALPKAPTPARSKDTPSQRNSTPQTPERTAQGKHSTSPRPVVQQPGQPPGQPQTRQQQQYPPSLTTHTSPSYSAAPQSKPISTGGSVSPGMNGYQAFQGQIPPPGMMPRMSHGQQIPPFQPHGVSQPIGTQTRASVQNGPHQNAGISGNQQQQQQRPRGSIHDMNSGGFGQQFPSPTSATIGQSHGPSREMPPPPSGPPHSRTSSNQFDGLTLDTQTISSTAPPPIGRPAPIKRPSSVNKSKDPNRDRPRSLTANSEVDDLSNHLGSSALLDDTDEPLPTSLAEARHPSGAPGSLRSSSSMVASPFENLQSPFNSFSPVSRAPGDSWGRSVASHFGAPGMPPLTHGQAQSTGWGGLGMGGVPHSGAAGTGWNPSAATPSQSHSYGMPSYSRSTKNNPRAIIVRTFAVQAYKILASQSSGVENTGFFDFSDIVRHTVESGRQMYVDPGIQLSEIRNVLETDGDSSNGGGKFQVRTTDMKMGQGGRTLVRWAPDPMGESPYPEQGAFQQQHQGQRQQQQPLSHQTSMQGPFGGGNLGGGPRQGLGLGEVGSPVGEQRLPNLGGLGRL